VLRGSGGGGGGGGMRENAPTPVSRHRARPGPKRRCDLPA